MGVGRSVAESFGQSLRTARKSRGVGIEELAARAGVHRTTLSRWERGKSLPFAHELTRVLAALGANAAETRALCESLDARRAATVLATVEGDVPRERAAWPVTGGEVLRALRRRAGVSQRAVARVAGVAQSLVVKWEKDECLPGDYQLHAFCRTVAATDDERMLLASWDWRDADLIPREPDALGALAPTLTSDIASSSTVLLALAARYDTLYREGVVPETEALSAHGLYAESLEWEGRRAAARRAAAPVLEGVHRVRGRLTLAHFQGLFCQVGVRGNRPVSLGEGAPSPSDAGRLLALLDTVEDRFPPTYPALVERLRAQAWEAAGDVDEAEASYTRAYRLTVSAGQESAMVSWHVEFLCRQGLYTRAQAALRPPTGYPSEPNPGFYVQGWLNHAVAYAGTGDHREAEGFLARAAEIARRYGVEGHYRAEFDHLARRLDEGQDRARFDVF